MTSNKQRAEQLIAQADRKLCSGSGVMHKFALAFGMMDKSRLVEEAIELYEQAGNFLKLEREWSEAGKVFNKIADLQLGAGSKHEAATAYVNASNCYRKCSEQESVNSLLKAIGIYTDMGRFSIAAKHHVTIAEIYESNDEPKSMEHYSKAADYYQCEESNSSATRCLLNVARFSAKLKQYKRAIEIYESTGQSCLDNQLLKYGAKEHLLRAGLCHLCVDTLNAQIAIKRYEEMSPAFADSREGKFLKDISSKIEARDIEGFEEVVKEYDSISRLDPWFTILLSRIKNQIAPEDDLK